MVFATLAFLGAFGADQGLLTYFADLSGPGLPYLESPNPFLHCTAKLQALAAKMRQLTVPLSWATKVSEIGQQALLCAEGVEQSQGHKGLGIHRP